MSEKEKLFFGAKNLVKMTFPQALRVSSRFVATFFRALQREQEFILHASAALWKVQRFAKTVKIL